MRKLTADYLFTLDTDPIKEGVVVIDDRGKVLEVLNSRTNIDNPEVFEGILCPGLINAHGHLELSHLKGKVDRHTGLVNFILGVQKFRNADQGEVQQAIVKAEASLYEQGVVGMGDISNSEDTFEIKALKHIRYHTFLECFGFNPANAGLVLEKAVLLKSKLSTTGLEGSLNPHAPYSVSESLFNKISQAEKGILSIHNQESMAENEFYQSATGDFKRLYETFGIDISWFEPYGKNSLAIYQAWLGGQRKLLVHNTYTKKADLDSISRGTGYAFCLCPGANLFIENHLPDVPALIGSGWPILIGTDSLASNDQLNMIAEMYLIQHAYPDISLETMLGWACKNAADFFSWGEFGTISQGKTPGIVQVKGLGENFMLRPGSSSVRIA